MYFGVGWPHSIRNSLGDLDAPPPRQRVAVRYVEMNALAWQQLWYTWLELVSYLLWWLMGGLVALGGCYYVGQLVYMDWVRENPPPRIRFLAERRLRRDLARGLADLEEYLYEQDPAHVMDGRPRQPSRHWSRLRHGRGGPGGSWRDR